MNATQLVALLAPSAGHVALALSGIALVYSMAEVYRIDAVPGWNTWRTHASFALSQAGDNELRFAHG